jgi:hypothetical protein
VSKWIFVAVLLVVAPSSALATTEPTDPAVVEDGDVPDEQGEVTDTPLVIAPRNPSAVTTIPAGCPTPDKPQMVFIGELISLGNSTAVYQVLQVRAGIPAGYVTGDRVEVRYGQDVKFLEVGTRYLVGAASDTYSPILISKVREEAPLFGGDAVIGVGDAGSCPRVEDPIRTLNEDGSAIDTAVLSPLRDSLSVVVVLLLFAVALSLVLLLAAVLMRTMVRGAARGLRRR